MDAQSAIASPIVELRAGESQAEASVGRSEGPREEVERATVAIGSGRGGTHEGPNRCRIQRAVGASPFPRATSEGVVDVNYNYIPAPGFTIDLCRLMRIAGRK